MYYFLTLFIFALALPALAQNTKLDSLKAEYSRINHEIQKESAVLKLATVRSLVEDNDALTTAGFIVQADTTDGEYVQIVMPDSLMREAQFTLQETGKHGIPFISTSDPTVLRIPANWLSRAAEALEAAFPAPTR